MSFSQTYKVILTPTFEFQARELLKKYPHIKTDFLTLKDSLKKDPITGHDSLGKDCFKVRMAISDKNVGKSGGARVIIAVKVIDKEVYLLTVYNKGEKNSLIKRELEKLLTLKQKMFPKK
jgi:hypothetical protein